MIIGVFKPAGITSHDVVNKVRKITGEKRVGHGGTLDPFATGVLVIGITRESTKKLGETLNGADKEYVALAELGKTSTTGDIDGKISESAPIDTVVEIAKSDVENSLKNFVGEINQTPPQYSAIKIKGTPAYLRAMRGEFTKLKERKVFIKELELISFDPPYIKIRAVVSSGTYIRTLVEDIGKNLGVGAYTKELTRTRVGQFTIEECITLDKLEKLEA